MNHKFRGFTGSEHVKVVIIGKINLANVTKNESILKGCRMSSGPALLSNYRRKKWSTAEDVGLLRFKKNKTKKKKTRIVYLWSLGILSKILNSSKSLCHRITSRSLCSTMRIFNSLCEKYYWGLGSSSHVAQTTNKKLYIFFSNCIERKL